MKRLSIIFLVLCLALCSCRRLEEPPVETDPVVEEDTADSKVQTDTAPVVTTPEDAPTDTAKPLPCLIGFYDDLENNGTYTRLSKWNEPWVQGKDIAVFDVIPSAEETLYSESYSNIWKSESNKISSEDLVKPYFLLEYTLIDGTQKSVEIYSYKDAEEITDAGYIEIYLYDDIHQDGGWYSHLVESTTNDETVISSIKVTAGKMIASVQSITLSAYIDGSSPATVVIRNGE